MPDLAAPGGCQLTVEMTVLIASTTILAIRCRPCGRRSCLRGPSDRRQLEDRDDILCYRSAPLTEAVEIAGYPEAVLFRQFVSARYGLFCTSGG